jgi:hypothetical protein
VRPICKVAPLLNSAHGSKRVDPRGIRIERVFPLLTRGDPRVEPAAALLPSPPSSSWRPGQPPPPVRLRLAASAGPPPGDSAISISLLHALRLRRKGSKNRRYAAPPLRALLFSFYALSWNPTLQSFYLVQVLHWFPHFPCLGTLREDLSNQVSSCFVFLRFQIWGLHLDLAIWDYNCNPCIPLQ